MTVKQRENHIRNINNLLLQYGAIVDRWGMYHIGKRKFDTRERNLKIYVDKVKVKSETLSQVDLISFEKYLQQFFGGIK